MIAEKYQDKDKFILNNQPSDIKLTSPIILRKHTLLLQESYMITLRLSTTLSIYFKIITELNLFKRMVQDLGVSLLMRQFSQIIQVISKKKIDEGKFYTEGNKCGVIDISVIETTFENDYIHILHDLLNQYIYGNLVSELIRPKKEIQSII